MTNDPGGSRRNGDTDPIAPWELQASTAIDGEIASDELLSLLDRMADDPRCRRFWKDARRTQALIDGAGIESRQVPVRTSRHLVNTSPRRSFARVAIAISAALIIGVGLLSIPFGQSPVRGDDFAVKIAENAGDMSDDRFLDLTVELLRADRRYHAKMLDILEDVHVQTFVAESASDNRRPPREARLARSDHESNPESTGRWLDNPAATY